MGEYDVYDELLYYAMTHDDVRNRAYQNAIRQSVKGKVVLDIGTGADAILARFCVEGGATRVYAIEDDSTAYHSAKTLIENLALTDRITVLHGHSAHVQVPEPADVCVSEILGTIGSSEGAVSILNDAWRLLRDDGIMLPRKCVTLFAPVSLPENLASSPRLNELPRTYVKRVFRKVGQAFDLRMCIKDFPPSNILARPQIFEELDFRGFVRPEIRIPNPVHDRTGIPPRWLPILAERLPWGRRIRRLPERQSELAACFLPGPLSEPTRGGRRRYRNNVFLPIGQ